MTFLKNAICITAAVVLGIGLNVNEEHFPQELRTRATSLRLELGREIDRIELLAAILESLEEDYPLLLEENADEITRRWMKYSQMMEREIRVESSASEIIEGLARGIAPDGGLFVQTANGIRKVLAGDVTIL